MPRKQHLWLRLCLEILTHKRFKQLVRHLLVSLLIEIIAVATSQIATGANGLEHHVEWTTKGNGRAVHFFLRFLATGFWLSSGMG